MISIAVIGLGNRGSIYMRYAKTLHSGECEIISICDSDPIRLGECKEQYSIKDDMCFSNEDDFFKEKRADAIFICTQDRDHYQHALKAISLGYNIMCEKPVSPSIAECEEIESKAREKNLVFLVCHVLRYSKYYVKLKQLLDSGIIGELKNITHTENIGHYHYAHSYVRGNWRDSSTTSPLIMAKTCHDMDLLYWFMGTDCKRLSSFGSLSYFKADNAPQGSTDYCLGGCSVKNTCPFDAEHLYITAPLHQITFLKFLGRTLTGKNGASKADKYAALRTGPYGRCVYKCDNNVVDSQKVNMDFGDGKTATLTVTAFNKRMYRETHFMGTKGDIRCNDLDGKIHIKVFRGKSKNIRTRWLPIPGHSGGDNGLVRDFILKMNGKETIQKDLSTMDVTLHSHRMALAAEQSRLNKGKVIELKEFKD